jgi:hypothetical protein
MPLPLTAMSIRIETSDITKLDNWKDKKAKQKLFNDLTERVGERFAQRAMGRMSDLLKPGHKFNVGASGDASKGFAIQRVSSVMGMVSWEVVETRKENMFIRRGFKGVDRKKRRRIPIDKIRRWAAYKRIHLTDKSGELGMQYAWTRFDVRKSRKGNPYIQSIRERDSANAILARIVSFLEFHGSKKSHWRDLYPKSSPRFDYVAYVARRDDMWQKEIAKTGDMELSVLLDYIMGGRKRGKPAYGARTYQSW